MASASQLVEQVAHSEPLADVGTRVELSSGIESQCIFCNNVRCQCVLPLLKVEFPLIRLT